MAAQQCAVTRGELIKENLSQGLYFNEIVC